MIFSQLKLRSICSKVKIRVKRKGKGIGNKELNSYKFQVNRQANILLVLTKGIKLKMLFTNLCGFRMSSWGTVSGEMLP